MSSSMESLPETLATTDLTGKARAKARSEAWKIKQNERFMAEMDAERERRFFPHLDAEGRAQLYAQYAEIEERAHLEREREAAREHHETVIEPTVDVDNTDFQTLTLPSTTVPLTVAVQDIYTSLRQRVGPSISSWCPPETLFRFSHAQFLYYVDPTTYHSLSDVRDYENFEGIVRAIQLNAYYVDDDIEIVPLIDHLNPRCITLESVDRFRHMPAYFYRYVFPEILQYDLGFMRTMQPQPNGYPALCGTNSDRFHNDPVLPYDYGLLQLHNDGRLVAKCLKYYRPSDTGMFRPRDLLTSLLPRAPYLALLNQLPIRELARRDRSLISTAVYPKSLTLTFPLYPRVLASGGYIPLLTPSEEEREELVAMVLSGNLPSGSDSAWDDIDEDGYSD